MASLLAPVTLTPKFTSFAFTDHELFLACYPAGAEPSSKDEYEINFVTLTSVPSVYELDPDRKSFGYSGRNVTYTLHKLRTPRRLSLLYQPWLYSFLLYFKEPEYEITDILTISSSVVTLSGFAVLPVCVADCSLRSLVPRRLVS